MIFDARQLTNSDTTSVDICIVGAGAAGITMAQELAASGMQVLILEAGGLKYSPETQRNYDGQEVGDVLRFNPNYLSTSRLRFFGGTTNHWGGMCRPLDKLDFLPREWVSDSGWPISKKDLDEYYLSAAPYCGLDYTADSEERRYKNTTDLLDLKGRGFNTQRFYLCRPLFSFAKQYRETIAKMANVRVLLNATLVSARLDDTFKRIVEVQARRLDGSLIKIRARSYVLACGGIENARILLNLDQQQSAGLANSSGAVGRYFMEHTEVTVAELLSFEANKTSCYANYIGHSGFNVFAPNEVEQKSNRLLNVCFQLVGGKTLGKEKDTSRKKEAKLISSLAGRKLQDNELSRYRLIARSEQTPNPNSRLTLINARDSIGMRRIRLDWKAPNDDFDNLLGAVRSFSAKLGANQVGRLKLLVNKETAWQKFLLGNHHIGTTRMHADPRKGVVDANCRTHDIDNLYIAGSSVFSTGGYANPTFTLVALAIRLSDHLKEVSV